MPPTRVCIGGVIAGGLGNLSRIDGCVFERNKGHYGGFAALFNVPASVVINETTFRNSNNNNSFTCLLASCCCWYWMLVALIDEAWESGAVWFIDTTDTYEIAEKLHRHAIPTLPRSLSHWNASLSSITYDNNTCATPWTHNEGIAAAPSWIIVTNQTQQLPPQNSGHYVWPMLNFTVLDSFGQRFPLYVLNARQPAHTLTPTHTHKTFICWC